MEADRGSDADQPSGMTSRPVPCTYEDCPATFKTEAEMKKHKRREPMHDYCHKCDQDYPSYDDYTKHKAFRPDNHDKACRVCGEEFKTKSGLLRHIELYHKIDQKLACIGCGEQFYRGSLLIEHLEFGNCKVISAAQFQGHVIHKFLVMKLLEGGAEYERFLQKISKFEATVDHDNEGGVDLPLVDYEEEVSYVEYEAIKPEINEAKEAILQQQTPWPALPSTKSVDGICVLSSTFQDLSLEDGRETAWESGKSSSNLFPTAKPTPPAAWSLDNYDKRQEQEHGINILSTRFWDPASEDYKVERFLDPVTCVYYCPFICEQTFPIEADLSKHIMQDHRIANIKCPHCLHNYRSVTAFVCHCESRGGRCEINKAEDFNQFLNKLTGGFLSVEEKTRPDHVNNPEQWVFNKDMGRMERYLAPTASYLQYVASRPADYKEPIKTAYQVGGGPVRPLGYRRFG